MLAYLEDIRFLFAKSFETLIPLLLVVLYVMLFERKVLAAIQLRRGPRHVGFGGLLQPFADVLKLARKELLFPGCASKATFLLAPLVAFTFSLSAWAVIPLSPRGAMAEINGGLLFFWALFSLGGYGVVLAGWSSGSSYPFLSAMRGAAQMVSYKSALGLVILCLAMSAGSTSLTKIVEAQSGLWFCVLHAPLLGVFFLCALAASHRLPFDATKAEAELVGGFLLEYSSTAFLLFLMAEYANILAMSLMLAILFCGGWLPPVSWWPFAALPGWVWLYLKASFFLAMFFWVRAACPRYRYDQFMRLGWKFLLPLCLVWLVGTALWCMLRP